ncbi:ABC transporter A family member 1 [Citrus sinensis]|uniref:ABC transporter A family member 1 n=1 Tax=Citrus sinensis TaxID=2711 RepID=A0ACB8HXP4_CITSI|nr:ABC transporter A family member 1 [Citrus sinensis]
MGTAKRHLKAMLRKNWLLKVRHPFVTAAEILLPTVVMLLLIAVRTRVDTRIHPAQPYIRKDMFVEIGKGVSPNFVQALELMLAKGEYLAFAPDTEETRTMINLMSIKFPKLKLVSRIYKDELELETYIRSDLYAQQTGANVATENVEIPPSNLSGTHLSLKQPWTLYSPSNIRMVPFPTREYTDDEFQSIIKRVMGVLYLLGFLYPISRLISYSVFEKFAVSSGIITACTMDSLFKYSDKTVVFTYFFSFGLSAITLSFFISTFFARAKTAVAVGTLSFLGAFFPYYTVNDEAVPMVLKVIASLLSPTAFALGSVNFADYERAHVGLRWSNMWRASSGVNFLVCLLMMLLDTLLYGVIGLYLDKVLPKENGVRYRWNFIFQNCFRRKKSVIKHHVSSAEVKINKKLSKEKECAFALDACEPVVEAISLDMKQQEVDGRCIQIRKLHKVYATKRGNCCAVNSLQLTLYENQILALLGHNGAGKSTTISMLVGLIPPTTGDALVFGKNITADMDEIRKGLGVCPQYDILFPELTVREHLEMFAVLKGVKEELLESVVAEMVDEVGLADKVNIVVRALSGGMKRKLSLGIALIGDSKVVILDEPTSGMDPYSMRLTWQLIKKIKKGRIILLTTHSMDEAEELGDRIAIMANGSLKCCGSSLFLKHQYGVGYTLTLVKSAPDASAAADIVYRHIPSALCVSEVGTEITFKLPLASSSSFESMFREIESCIRKSVSKVEADATEDTDYLGIESFGISVTTLEEVFLRVAGCNLDESECISQRNNLVTLDYVSAESDDQAPKRISNCKLFGNYKWVFGFIVTVVQRACTLIVAAVLGFLNFLIKKCCTCCIISRSMFWQHCKALFIKRAVSARRDRKTIVFQLLIPAIFLLVGLLFLKLKPHPDMLSVTFTTSNFNPLLSGGGGGGPIPFDLSWPIANEVSKYIQGGWIQRFKQSSYRFPNAEKALADAVDAAGPTLGPVLLSMSEYLMSSFNESYQSRYGAIVMDDQNDDGSLGFTVLHNSSCQHAGPTFINVMNTAILRLATGNRNMTIRTRNHPLPTTQSQQLQRHDLDAFSVSIIISIAFSFIPASFAVAIVKEREVKAKQQQLISGVSVLSYWTSTYIWDFISFLFPSSCAIILFYIFGLDQFVGRGCLLPTVLIFLGYGLAIASSTYCLTFFFSDHTMAQNVVLLVHFFTGLILMVISFIMGLLEATRSANSLLKFLLNNCAFDFRTLSLLQNIAFVTAVTLLRLKINFFRLSPGFCFADGLASLALLRQGMKDKTSDGVFDWNVTSASICYLGCESICYFLLTLGLELLPSHKWTLMTIKEWWKGTRHRLCNTPSSYLEPLLQSSSESDTLDLNEDVDVQVERNRVLSGSVDNAIIYLRNLRKVYPGGKRSDAKVAVHSLTFSVQAGECFGFLGTNGAGKTTTLSMISGEEYPTDGTAFIFGKDIRSDPKAARRLIGYCPQFDALLEYLTVQEHLELYARIKGVAEYRMDDVVMEKLVEFDLLKHAKKPSFTLSGGNKRKLSVAIAMIGDPPIVILDEPSTGMDPIAKRFMWEVISRLSTRQGKTAVILTTHSMNEAQALCTRIGIMVGGQLRCIGSPQHLKTRFGNFLELEVKPTEVSSVDLEDLCQIIQERVFDIPSQRRSLLDDLEVCIGGIDSISSENATAAEISLSQEMLLIVGRWLGNEERIKTLISSSSSPDRIFGEQLSEQLVRDGGIQLPIFSEWWLAKEKFAVIDSFILSSFPGSTFQGCNGLSVKYQLPFSEGLSVADIFGLLEQNRNASFIKAEAKQKCTDCNKFLVPVQKVETRLLTDSNPFCLLRLFEGKMLKDLQFGL